jgi:hypothetical protein
MTDRAFCSLSAVLACVLVLTAVVLLFWPSLHA